MEETDMLNYVLADAAATVAATANGSGTGAAGNSWVSTLILVVVMVAVFYFLIIRPQKKRDKQAKDMREAIKVGDEIVTIGGICGKVVHIKDDKFVIETGADQVRMEFAKWALSTNESGAKRAKEEAKKAEEARAKAKAEKKAEKSAK